MFSFRSSYLFPILSAAVILIGGFFCIPARAEMSRDTGYGLQTAVSSTDGKLSENVARGSTDIRVAIGVVVGYGLGLVGVVFFILMLYAGINWMFAMGNTEKIDTAKSTMIMAALGLIVVLSAYAIAAFIFGALGATAATGR